MADPKTPTEGPLAAEMPDVVHVEVGRVPPSAWDQADGMMARLAGKAPRPVLFARVKIHVDAERDPDDQTIAQATMDVSGRIVRAQVGAPTPEEALNCLSDRMETRVRRSAEKRRDAGRLPPGTPEGTWRSGDLPTARPGFHPRPREDRRLVRRKTYAPQDRISIEEALFDLDVLDHRFFLFTAAADGEVSVVYEDEDGFKLRRESGGAPPDGIDPIPAEFDPTPAPELDLDEAIDRLDVGGATFIFFRNAESGQGNVVYRRYDGHHGVVEPRTTG